MSARAAEKIRARHVERFREPHLHGRLVSRIALGNLVVDHEIVTRNFDEGRGEVEVVAIYEIRNRLIANAWFKMGEKRLEGGGEIVRSGSAQTLRPDIGRRTSSIVEASYCPPAKGCPISTMKASRNTSNSNASFSPSMTAMIISATTGSPDGPMTSSRRWSKS